MGNYYVETKPGFLGLGRKRDKLINGLSTISSRGGRVLGAASVSLTEDVLVITPGIGAEVVSTYAFAKNTGSPDVHGVTVDLKPGEEAVLSIGEEKVKLFHKK